MKSKCFSKVQVLVNMWVKHFNTVNKFFYNCLACTYCRCHLLMIGLRSWHCKLEFFLFSPPKMLKQTKKKKIQTAMLASHHQTAMKGIKYFTLCNNTRQKQLAVSDVFSVSTVSTPSGFILLHFLITLNQVVSLTWAKEVKQNKSD